MSTNASAVDKDAIFVNESDFYFIVWLVGTYKMHTVKIEIKSF